MSVTVALLEGKGLQKSASFCELSWNINPVPFRTGKIHSTGSESGGHAGYWNETFTFIQAPDKPIDTIKIKVMEWESNKKCGYLKLELNDIKPYPNVFDQWLDLEKGKGSIHLRVTRIPKMDGPPKDSSSDEDSSDEEENENDNSDDDNEDEDEEEEDEDDAKKGDSPKPRRSSRIAATNVPAPKASTKKRKSIDSKTNNKKKKTNNGKKEDTPSKKESKKDNSSSKNRTKDKKEDFKKGGKKDDANKETNKEDGKKDSAPSKKDGTSGAKKTDKKEEKQTDDEKEDGDEKPTTQRRRSSRLNKTDDEPSTPVASPMKKKPAGKKNTKGDKKEKEKEQEKSDDEAERSADEESSDEGKDEPTSTPTKKSSSSKRKQQSDSRKRAKTQASPKKKKPQQDEDGSQEESDDDEDDNEGDDSKGKNTPIQTEKKPKENLAEAKITKTPVDSTPMEMTPSRPESAQTSTKFTPKTVDVKMEHEPTDKSKAEDEREDTDESDEEEVTKKSTDRKKTAALSKKKTVTRANASRVTRGVNSTRNQDMVNSYYEGDAHSEEDHHNTENESEEDENDDEEEEEEYDPLEDIRCKKCASPEDDDKLLLCDGCNNGYHMYCLDPPLHSIPDGDWFCPECVERRANVFTTTEDRSSSSSGVLKLDRVKKVTVSIDTDEEDEEEGSSVLQKPKNRTAKKMDAKARLMKKFGIGTKDKDIGLAMRKTIFKKPGGPSSSVSPAPSTVPPASSPTMSAASTASTSPIISPPSSTPQNVRPKPPSAKKQLPTSNVFLVEEFTKVKSSGPKSSPPPPLKSSNIPSLAHLAMMGAQSPSASPAASPPLTPLQPEKDIPNNTSPPSNLSAPRSTSPANASTSPTVQSLSSSGSGIPSASVSPSAPSQAPAKPVQQLNTTTSFWKGGVIFDGKLIGDMRAYCSQKCLATINKKELPDVLHLQKGSQLPPLTHDVEAVYFAPDKNDPSFKYFLWNLDKNQWVGTVDLPSATFYVFPSTLTPSLAPAISGSFSLLGVLLQKPKPQPQLQLEQGRQFMKGVRYHVVGHTATDAKLSNVVNFMDKVGGAVYKQILAPNDVDLVVIANQFLPKLSEVPHIAETRISPHVMFVKSLDYLEHCCFHKAFLNPKLWNLLLFPPGGIMIIEAEMILNTEDILTNLLNIIEKEKKTGADWVIKLPKDSLTKIEEFKSIAPRALKASEIINANMGKLIQVIADEEESKSMNYSIPSIIRSAIKMSFMHSSKCRHVVLLTSDKNMQSLAKLQKLLCVDYDGIVQFFNDQERQRKQPNPITVPMANIPPPQMQSNTIPAPTLNALATSQPLSTSGNSLPPLSTSAPSLASAASASPAAMVSTQSLLAAPSSPAASPAPAATPSPVSVTAATSSLSTSGRSSPTVPAISAVVTTPATPTQTESQPAPIPPKSPELSRSGSISPRSQTKPLSVSSLLSAPTPSAIPVASPSLVASSPATLSAPLMSASAPAPAKFTPANPSPAPSAIPKATSAEAILTSSIPAKQTLATQSQPSSSSAQQLLAQTLANLPGSGPGFGFAPKPSFSFAPAPPAAKSAAQQLQDTLANFGGPAPGLFAPPNLGITSLLNNPSQNNNSDPSKK